MTICYYGDPLCPCQEGDACNHADSGKRPPVTQEVIIEQPPMYQELAFIFRLHDRRDVIFSFGDRIYNPYQLAIEPHIAAHEAIHGIRQGIGTEVLEWWRRYMDDPMFRYIEELVAHRAEYYWLTEHGNRHQRRRALREVSTKLASTLYGGMVTQHQAKHDLKHGGRYVPAI